MNKTEKLLQKLDPKTRARVEQALLQLHRGELEDLNIKKIKGSDDVFRARVGSYRIIFRQANKQVRLMAVTKRDEKTYTTY